MNYRSYKRVAERANILLTWTEARGRSSFFRKHLPPIKLRVVIRFYPQSIPLTAVRIKRQAEMKTVFVIFAALMVCYAITLVERWACHLDGLFVFADTEFRSNLQIWWPHFFAGAKKSFYVYDMTSGAPNVTFRKISVWNTIWDLEFSEHLSCKISCLPASPRIFKLLENGIIAHFKGNFYPKKVT